MRVHIKCEANLLHNRLTFSYPPASALPPRLRKSMNRERGSAGTRKNELCSSTLMKIYSYRKIHSRLIRASRGTAQFIFARERILFETRKCDFFVR